MTVISNFNKISLWFCVCDLCINIKIRQTLLILILVQKHSLTIKCLHSSSTLLGLLGFGPDSMRVYSMLHTLTSNIIEH